MLKCILLVDDNAVIRRSLRVIFEQEGWHICGEAANGRGAIAKAQELHPDLIVLDLSMPVMNGMEAAPPGPFLSPPNRETIAPLAAPCSNPTEPGSVPDR